MGKSMRIPSSKLSLPNNGNGNSRVTKILDALNRRHKWQNTRKGLPNKRQGSGKQITDGGSSEATASTSQPPEVPKKNKPPKLNEQESAETRSKKFRIRSLISSEMAKRRGKNQWRRSSSSPTHSPKKKANSTSNSNSNTSCQSPGTIKKRRKCDICAAMLTVSYLRQRATDHVPDRKPAQIKSRNVGLTKSLSFPLLAAKTKKRDAELQELKHKLRNVKDIQTTKDRFILPMNQWAEFPKPMLTRPASFRATAASTSRKDSKKQNANQSKSLKQKIGLVIKVDGRKEKRRILMDAVFHKVPYGGRKSSKDPKKVGPDKLKSSKNSSGDKAHHKKTSSTSESMSKYRKLLSQTSTRDEKLMKQHSTDHKPKLFVAGNRKTHKRMRSLPNISPDDFTQNHEFPEKPTMEIHINTNFDDQISTDRLVYPERRNAPDKQETKLVEKDDEDVDENTGVGTDESTHQEKNSESEAEHETSSIEKDEAMHENHSHESQEQSDHQRHVVDEDLGVETNSSDGQEEPRVAIQLENDKPFNEILGMFKKVSDEKLRNENKSSGVVRKQVADNTADHQEEDNSSLASDSDHTGVPQNAEVHNEEDTLSLTSGYEVDDNLEVEKEDSAFYLSSLIDIRNSLLEFENKRRMSSMNDVNGKRANMGTSAANKTVKNGFLHLDLESVKDNAEFQFVKQVLEKSGFLKNTLLGEWYSSYQPIDPLLFEEVETSFLQTKLLEDLDSMKDEEVVQKIINDHHLLLFDLINEALLEIHNRTYTYCPHALTYRSKVSPMPVGCRVLEQVWDIVNMYLSWKPELQPSLDDIVSRDLAKGSGWMNLQADAEFVGIELEELLVDDLLDELVFDDLLM
ncbi:hypothetical protein HanXRQr2_Chr15g0679241 [Helianthus annuus]|uniref:DUF4378 domain-containing protein n=2 Tax=Helianthus annuus TaxID=4232 RepID=A0A9K3DYH2_HELAN|nr:uncharacterized protein LOC110910722 [Helianthus annuus]KAF5763353.1 hypothetical protein HanXRQr2_Chr15g0679241 [Helianthus annuus]KAJ0454254.1 hypothetical protein HanIR_Chr15g0738021 [Helianthus annuus]KAJ0472023.1 putative protein TRM32 [Helianthus annuus]KAJ0651493.1 putative protein TRM32 [Helianthus annuus]